MEILNYKRISILLIISISFSIISCKVIQPVAMSPFFPMADEFESALIGVSILDEATGEYLVQMNANRHFSPASNTKFLTAFATLKHFGDSMPGWVFHDGKDTLHIVPQGDPTFLHPKFESQNFFEFIRSSTKPVVLILENDIILNRFGTAWPWSTWLNTYSPERSEMPIYGNMVRVIREDTCTKLIPSYFCFSNKAKNKQKINLTRGEYSNHFIGKVGKTERLERPFYTQENDSLLFSLLRDTLLTAGFTQTFDFSHHIPNLPFKTFYTQETDSVVALMMKKSDNFIAEQLLLMVSKNKLDRFDEIKIKESLIKNDFQHAIKTGRWADGSGLSRNNLFTPNEIVALLKAMQKEFGRDRLFKILPHGNEGTLSGLYKDYEQNIFAKTGTLSGNVALSGYLITKKGKRLIFSIIINNHRGKPQEFRKAIESRLIDMIENY